METLFFGGKTEVKAYAIGDKNTDFTLLVIGDLEARRERYFIAKCLINYNKA